MKTESLMCHGRGRRLLMIEPFEKWMWYCKSSIGRARTVWTVGVGPIPCGNLNGVKVCGIWSQRSGSIMPDGCSCYSFTHHCLFPPPPPFFFNSATDSTTSTITFHSQNPHSPTHSSVSLSFLSGPPHQSSARNNLTSGTHRASHQMTLSPFTDYGRPSYRRSSSMQDNGVGGGGSEPRRIVYTRGSSPQVLSEALRRRNVVFTAERVGWQAIVVGLCLRLLHAGTIFFFFCHLGWFISHQFHACVCAYNKSGDLLLSKFTLIFCFYYFQGSPIGVFSVLKYYDEKIRQQQEKRRMARFNREYMYVGCLDFHEWQPISICWTRSLEWINGPHVLINFQ